MRGGERVLEAIARVGQREWSLAPTYTMFRGTADLGPVLTALDVRTSPLSTLPPGTRRLLLPAYPLAVRYLSKALAREHARHPIDLLFSTHSSAIKAIRPPAGVPHVCYCHAPARYLWSQSKQYATGSLVRRAGLAAFGPWLRSWDRSTASRVTTFVANSTHTAGLIRDAYGRESEVIHPPARTGFFTTAPITRSDAWLIAGALEPYKRVDLAIEAAAAAGARLVVAGEGSERVSLEQRAARLGADVEFVGRVSDERLRGLMRTARCFLFPQIEDFGIVAVEAQACGCPVVARRAGGALDSVIEGKTGSFFNDPTPESLAAAVDACPLACDDACRLNAERFGQDVFESRISEIARRTLGTTSALRTT